MGEGIRIARRSRKGHSSLKTTGGISLPYNWDPRPDQLPLWCYLQNGGKRAVCVAHRKWGKDTVGLRWASVAATKRVGTYWHMLPKYSEARKAIWEPIDPVFGRTRIEDTFPKELIASKRDTDMYIKFTNGSTWNLVGSDNFDSLVGAPPLGIIFSEYSLCDPRAWAYMRPILAQNGGWAIFLYTFRGQNHGVGLYDFAKAQPDWYCQIVRASQSTVFTPEKLKKELEELKAEWGEVEGQAFYDQEYECSPTSFQFGAYYAKQMRDAHAQGRVGKVEWTPQLPVYTAWDLGVDDSMSIWFFQVSGSRFNFIEYYENVGENFAFYAEELLTNRPYIYATHYLPHDVKVREMGAGTAGEGARSRQDSLEELGIKPITVVDRARDIQAVLSGIFSVREILPYCYFDETKCARGISGLEGYRSEYDMDKKKLRNQPVHDWTSHPADAFRTFGVGWRKDNATPGRNPMELMDKYYGGLT